ncbi:MAG: restriction endonuclease [Methylococcales bacterium]
MKDAKVIPKLRARDLMTVDDLFIREGYVLRFSDGQTAFNDRTFAEFFSEELSTNIDDPKWSVEGTSKGKRLRYFLRTADAAVAIKTLKALWDYREIYRQRHQIPESIENARTRLEEVLAHLGGASQMAATSPTNKDGFQHVKYDVIHRALISLTDMSPQQRGYQFEKFLKKLFDAFALQAEKPFRLVGEQIDGSFVLDSDTYLVEAKWQNEQTGVGDLHAFHGKLDQRASWGRGLFVSYSGFTEQGLIAFGRARKVICLDGRDLSEMFQRQLPLPEVLRRKVRRAVEYGVTLARVSDLFHQ